MRNITLTEKIILNILLLGICIIIIIASYSFYTSRNALMDRTFEQLTSLQTVKKNQIENFFTDRIRDIQLISGSEDALKLLHIVTHHYNLSNNTSKIEETKINKEYELFLNKYYDNYLIFNDKGFLLCIDTKKKDNVLISYDTVSNFPLEELILKVKKTHKIFIQDFKLNYKHSHPSIYLGAPILDNKQNLIGIIALEISFDAINAIMYENNHHNGLGKTGESYLVGEDYLMRSESRFHKKALLKTKVKTQAVINAFNEDHGTKIITDYRNKEALSAYSKLDIPNLNWCIIAEIDLKEATIPVYKLLNNTLFISILLAIALFIFAYFISKKITRPIVNLTDASKKIGKGEFNEHLQIYSKDEIGALTESFNLMMSHLENQSQELKKERLLRLQSVIDGQEIERQRLSRELHDGLGQLLIAIKLKLESLIFTDRSKLLYTIEGIKTLFDSTIDEVKRISYDLMPAVLYEFGLPKAIRNLCEDIENRSHITITFAYECDADKLDKVMKTYLFRIVQEALNNIVKHAEATKVSIFLQIENNEIHLKIEDNGKGFEMKEQFQSLKTNGIYNMRERVNLLNGIFEIDSIPQKGTVINVKISLSKSLD
ncbi:MAG: HAMP domain-containing protein [Bacteroidales bacterium]